jgi:hypothetical protein
MQPVAAFKVAAASASEGSECIRRRRRLKRPGRLP